MDEMKSNNTPPSYDPKLARQQRRLNVTPDGLDGPRTREARAIARERRAIDDARQLRYRAEQADLFGDWWDSPLGRPGGNDGYF